MFMVRPMDFDLFMERYGYKILFGIFGVVLLVIIGTLLASFYLLFRYLGYFAASLVIVFLFAYAFTVKRRVIDAQAQAHAKYFYDDRRKR
ncbi:hypothetical protein [Thermococcus sp. LS1]|uniref:hypothetical protein n=1 Tax=Thermococcus sp. LS1 TaxID=1638259 RepID=UPI00351ACD55